MAAIDKSSKHEEGGTNVAKTDTHPSGLAVSNSFISGLNGVVKEFSTGHPDLDDAGKVNAFFKDTSNQGGFQPDAQSKSLLENLLTYISSEDADIVEHHEESDLSQPLSHYYISASHNTYLTGNQLYSSASTDGYKNVLLRGCRCVEIDIWDGQEPDSDDSSGDANNEKMGFREKWGLKKTSAEGEQSEKKWSTLKNRLTINRKSLHEKHTHDATDSKSHDSEPTVTDAADSTSRPTPWKPGSAQKSNVITEPRVLHGHTLTKEVSLRAVCEAIRDSAFVHSDLPIIVSLELHANLEQQALIVDIIKSTWSGHLVEPPKSIDPNEVKLPAPQDLRRKILVKVKYTPPEAAAKEQSDKPSMSSSSDDEESGDDKTSNQKTKAKKKKILDELSALGIYTRAFHFKSFDSKEATIPTHIFAVSESKLLQLYEDKPKQLFKHNEEYLMRVYPKATRITSANLDPLNSWRCGVQLAALNWQVCDMGTMLNEAMFAGTGGWVLKPAVLRGKTAPGSKDDGLLGIGADQTKHVDSTTASKNEYHGKLTVRIIAAENLPKNEGESIKPYVKLVVHTEDPPGLHSQSRRSTSGSSKLASAGTTHIGAHASPDPSKTGSASTAGHDKKEVDGAGVQSTTTKRRRDKQKSRTPVSVSPDAYNPLYPADKNVLFFQGLPSNNNPQQSLTFLRFKVMDDIGMRKDEVIAWACIRLDRVRNGLRYCNLIDAKGLRSEGRLLVWVKRE